MSWRTQGDYRGLGDADRDWLKDFDRDWDTKECGRSHGDAMDRVGFQAGQVPDDGDIQGPAMLEAFLIRGALQVLRFTVPRQLMSGWSIHLELRGGRRIRAHFDDLGAATQAYDVLQEFSQWFPKG